MTNALKTTAVKTIHLANPRGFCAGVDRAIEMVELALKNGDHQFMSGMK